MKGRSSCMVGSSQDVGLPVHLGHSGQKLLHWRQGCVCGAVISWLVIPGRWACSNCMWHLDGYLSPQTLSKVFSNSSDEDPGLIKHSKAGLTLSMWVIVLSCTMLDQDLGALTVGVCRHAAVVTVFVWYLVLIWKQLSVLIFSPSRFSYRHFWYVR